MCTKTEVINMALVKLLQKVLNCFGKSTENIPTVADA